MRRRWTLASITLTLIGAIGTEGADTATQVYESMGLKSGQVLSGSVIPTQVVPGDAKQVVAVVTYMTGKKDKARAVNVRLEVFAMPAGGSLTSIYSRDFGEENGGFVGQGDLQVVDLDGDGVNEIVVSYDNYADALIEDRAGEVLIYGDSGFESIWDGSMKYDATRAARTVPAERRDRFKREVDVVETLRTKGNQLVLKKTMIAVAGERLDEPKVVLESYPLRVETR